MKERLVYEYLCRNNVGRENLIKNKDLRSLFGINSDKAMRKVIQNIRENEAFDRLVGSVSGKSGGFFICQSLEEVLETIANTQRRANQMYKLVHIMKWKAKLGGLLNE